MKVEHLALQVADPVKMAKWYVEHLQMQVVRKGGKPSYGRFLADLTGRVILEIYHNPNYPVPDYASQPAAQLHLAFAVSDIDVVHANLVAAGAKPEGQIEEIAAGDRIAVVRDPWGLAVQLVKRAKAL